MSLGTIVQDDFSAGIVRQVEGQRIPQNGVYDLVNGLLDDDLGVYRRGGTVYLSDLDLSGSVYTGVWNGLLGAGERTVVWDDTELRVLDGTDLITFGVEAGTDPGAPSSRPVSIAGYLLLQSGGSVNAYAGSTSATDSYSTGTVTFTNGNSVVIGSGTLWLSNIAAGMILQSGNRYAIVASVEDDTHLTLLDAWTGSTGSGAAAAFSPYHTVISNLPSPADCIGVAGNKLLVAVANRVYMTPRITSSSTEFQGNLTEEFHLLPESCKVIAIEGVGDEALLFTTAGVFRISNLAYDLTDDYGNPQQQVRQVNKDLVLWDEAGIGAYRGSLVVPAIDDVYLFGLSGEAVPVSVNIRPLWREHVRDGYRLGYAAVFRNHYLLPVLDESTVVDVLVCRLDGASPGWSRWSDHAACTAFTSRVGRVDRSPRLYGVNGARLVGLGSCFAPSGAPLDDVNDADGTAHVLTVVTRDFALRPQVRTLWRYLRSRFELTDAGSDNPTLTLESSAGPPESESWVSSASWAEGTGEDSSKIAILNSDGNPGRRVQSIRFRIRSSGPAARLVLRSLELFYRPSGRQ